ncbi:MAG TPA: alpha/beta fold hydrolase [Mycobacterium sp.]|nr:alpha/beta fold hydrolase [Mycobacterium sp.]
MHVILMHPLGSDASFWDLVFGDALPAGYHAVDLPGHGAATGMPPTGLADYTRCVVEQVQSEIGGGAAPIVVVGISLGGLVAQQMLISKGLNVVGVVLVDTVPVYPEEMRQMWRDRATHLGAMGPARYIEQTVRQWFTPAYRCSHEGALAAIRVSETLRNTSSAGYAAACEILSTADTRTGVYGSPIKSLVVVGDQDAQPFQRAADWFMGALPHAAISRLSGAHAAPIESRKNFLSALTGFMLEIERENSARRP